MVEVRRRWTEIRRRQSTEGGRYEHLSGLFSAPQWGRDDDVAEDSREPWKNLEKRRLLWGRDDDVAEDKNSGGLLDSGIELQWGRDDDVAEDIGDRASVDAHRGASMGPRR